MKKDTDFLAAFMGGPRNPRTNIEYRVPYVVEGKILFTTEKGTYFRIGESSLRHGPAPYTTVVPPTVGARCLVIFVPPGIENPWVVGWWVE